MFDRCFDASFFEPAHNIAALSVEAATLCFKKNQKGVFARVFAKVRNTAQGKDLMTLGSHCSNSFQFRKLFDIKS